MRFIYYVEALKIVDVMRLLLQTYIDYGEMSRIFHGKQYNKYNEEITAYVKIREMDFYV